MQTSNHFKMKPASSFIPNADKDFNNPNAFRKAAKAGEAIQKPVNMFSQTEKPPVVETPRASNFFNSMMPERAQPQPEKKKSVLGNVLRGIAKGSNPELYEYEKANYDYGQQMKAQQAQEQEANFQAQRTQSAQNSGKMAHLMRKMTPEQRMEFASRVAQQNNMQVAIDPNDFTDDAIMSQMQQAQLAGWEMPQEQERPTMKDVNGVNRYVDTGEPVFAGVEREQERNLPTGMYWDENTQSAQWHPEYLEQENRAQGMTPQQQRQHDLNERKFQFEREKWEAEQQAEMVGVGFNQINPQQYEQSPFWGFQGEGAQLIKADFGSDMLPQAGDFGEDNAAGPQQRVAQQSSYNRSAGSQFGKQDAKRLSDIQSEASSVLNGSQLMRGQMQDLLNSGVPIGPLAETRAGLSRAGLGFLPGVPDAEGGAQLDAFGALSTELTVELTGKLAGAISEYEMKQIARAVPNWSQSPEGAQKLLDLSQARDERILAFSEAAAQWADLYGGLSVQDSQGRTFDNVWAEYSRANPIIGKPLSGSNSSSNSSESSGPQEGQTATNPNTGEKIIYRNGAWSSL